MGTDRGHDLPPAAYVAGMVHLVPDHPDWLACLLRQLTPAELWGRLTAGDAEGLRALAGAPAPVRQRLRLLAPRAAQVDLRARWARHEELGVTVTWQGQVSYPVRLLDDPDPPPVLFARGDLGLLGSSPLLAMIGTRRCTPYGRDVARELADTLTRAGVHIVSGLALGIDGAAHEGVLRAFRASKCGAASSAVAAPIGVVGSGLDRVYPRRHRSLWEAVGDLGLLLTEAPLGGAPEPWRFPERNRIIAGLADAVLVVESHPAGGSMVTVRLAMDRDKPILAVPGPIRSSASRGTNRLIGDFATLVQDEHDVFVALGLATSGQRGTPVEHRTAPLGAASRVLDALGWEPASAEQLAVRTALSLGDVACSLYELAASGWVTDAGGWWQRCVAP